MSAFRITIFTNAPSPKVRHLLWRLSIDLPEVQVAGILYEDGPARLEPKQQHRVIKKSLPDPGFIRFTGHTFAAHARRGLKRYLTHILHAAHGTNETPNHRPISLRELVGKCEEHGIAFCIAGSLSEETKLRFVEDLRADLGVIFGTDVPRPQLFSTPRLGSICIRQYKVLENDGSSLPGPFEIRDGKIKQTVTVHSVGEGVDFKGLLCGRDFPIDPFDTLVSILLKADLIGIDCLIDVIRTASRSQSAEIPPAKSTSAYKYFESDQNAAIEEYIYRRQKSLRAQHMRPFIKLVPRMLAYPALYIRNRRRARAKNFPIVIFYYHLIADRKKSMSLPTHLFLRHVRFLKEHYRIVSLPESIELLKKGEIDVPTVVLTFDDGYGDNFLGLRAVAEAENIPVTLFICTQNVTDRSEFQHDIDLNEPGFPALSWDEIRYLDKHNFCIGSHTRNHFNCSESNEVRLRDEIQSSLKDLCQELGHDVLYFAFPFGHPQNMSEPARRIALQVYPYVFSAYGGLNYRPFLSGVILKRCGAPQSLLELDLTLQSLLD